MKRKVFIWEIETRDKGNGVIVVWNDKRVFYDKLLYFKVIQHDTGFQSSAKKGYWEEFKEVRRDLPFKIVAVGKDDKVDLPKHAFTLKKKDWFGFVEKEVEFSITSFAKIVEEESKIDDVVKREELKIETSIDWIRNIVRVGLLVGGGVVLWRRIASLKK